MIFASVGILYGPRYTVCHSSTVRFRVVFSIQVFSLVALSPLLSMYFQYIWLVLISINFVLLLSILMSTYGKMTMSPFCTCVSSLFQYFGIALIKLS